MNYDIYVGGRFVQTSEEIQVKNPHTGELVATTYLAGKEELETSISKAESIKDEMANLPSYKKYEILMEIAHGIEKDKDRLAAVLAKEAAKPLKYALGEIMRASQTFLVAAEEAKRLPGEVLSIDWTPAGAGKEGYVKYFPIGLVAGIAPFNFPLNLAVHKIAPAIAAGNPIILKPSRSTPLSVLELAKIIDKTALPKGAVSILPMDRVAGNQLITDPRFSMISFTGSPSVGWKIKRDAGKKKVVLELGGNAGVIVSGSANLDLAVAKTVVGGYAYSGQVCIHVQRILVHESIFDPFAEKFIEKLNLLKVGKPEDANTDISAMIDEENAIRVEEWVNEAVADGAKILAGGKRSGSYFEPTLLTCTRLEMKVCSLEVFGPVVTLEKYNDFHEAVAYINDSEYGLQAGVFTDTLSEMNYAFQKLEVGGVIINDVPTFRVDHMPYGGIKNSGFGREGLKYAIHEMLEPRLLVKNIL
ncbi:MAG: aldehyde dehydrogenase family protein [Bacteroidales bacterium]|nr:aldehyde dehydrogenase family protein [Bacteroidales bacterium]MCF8456656.1 aldehyde dehydrogenase family protein [Bacteroidales bacterium]